MTNLSSSSSSSSHWLCCSDTQDLTGPVQSFDLTCLDLRSKPLLHLCPLKPLRPSSVRHHGDTAGPPPGSTSPVGEQDQEDPIRPAGRHICETERPKWFCRALLFSFCCLTALLKGTMRLESLLLCFLCPDNLRKRIHTKTPTLCRR